MVWLRGGCWALGRFDLQLVSTMQARVCSFRSFFWLVFVVLCGVFAICWSHVRQHNDGDVTNLLLLF
jgi:hypothetical protein